METQEEIRRMRSSSVTLPDSSRVSHADIIEEADQNILMMVRDYDRMGKFAIGDMSNRYIKEAVDASPRAARRVSARRVREAVGYFSGYRERTVRYYAETAAFFPPIVREMYADLPFSYFVLARRLRDGWREVLEYALENPGVTLDALERRFIGIEAAETDEDGETDPQEGGNEAGEALPVAGQAAGEENAGAAGPNALNGRQGETASRDTAAKAVNVRVYDRRRLMAAMSDLMDTVARLAALCELETEVYLQVTEGMSAFRWSLSKIAEKIAEEEEDGE